MPKLPSEAAKKATESAGGGFSPLEEATYRCRLVEVEAKTAASSGNPMWVWKLETADEKSEGKFLWVNTVLTDKAMWKVAEMFAAFNADTDTDTDELIGEFCNADVVQRVIEKGARAGQMGNDVARAWPIEGSAPAAGAPRAAEAAAEKADW